VIISFLEYAHPRAGRGLQRGNGLRGKRSCLASIPLSRTEVGKRSTWSAFAFFVSVCATNPAPSYDPDARETPARVIEKRIVGYLVQPTAEFRSTYVIPLRKLVLVMPAQGETAQIPVYEYTVKAKDGRRVTVDSEYPGFNAGQCVILFESARPDYPRIAMGSGCD
jgi:hypothetical protein